MGVSLGICLSYSFNVVNVTIRDPAFMNLGIFLCVWAESIVECLVYGLSATFNLERTDAGYLKCSWVSVWLGVGGLLSACVLFMLDIRGKRLLWDDGNIQASEGFKIEYCDEGEDSFATEK
jgi:hypothetical protein